MTNALSKSTRTGIARALIILALLICALFPGFPVLWMISSSLKSNVDIFAYPPRLISDSFSFDAYIAVLTDPRASPLLFQQLPGVYTGDGIHAHCWHSGRL